MQHQQVQIQAQGEQQEQSSKCGRTGVLDLEEIEKGREILEELKTELKESYEKALERYDQELAIYNN